MYQHIPLGATEFEVAQAVIDTAADWSNAPVGDGLQLERGDLDRIVTRLMRGRDAAADRAAIRAYKAIDRLHFTPPLTDADDRDPLTAAQAREINHLCSQLQDHLKESTVSLFQTCHRGPYRECLSIAREKIAAGSHALIVSAVAGTPNAFRIVAATPDLPAFFSTGRTLTGEDAEALRHLPPGTRRLVAVPQGGSPTCHKHHASRQPLEHESLVWGVMAQRLLTTDSDLPQIVRDAPITSTDWEDVRWLGLAGFLPGDERLAKARKSLAHEPAWFRDEAQAIAYAEEAAIVSGQRDDLRFIVRRTKQTLRVGDERYHRALRHYEARKAGRESKPLPDHAVKQFREVCACTVCNLQDAGGRYVAEFGVEVDRYYRMRDALRKAGIESPHLVLGRKPGPKPLAPVVRQPAPVEDISSGPGVVHTAENAEAHLADYEDALYAEHVAKTGRFARA